MVTHEELKELSEKSQGNYSLSEEELIAFVKGGAVRAYKVADSARNNEDVIADFNPETKELRLSVRKTVVNEVKDAHKECTQDEGKMALGEIASILVNDPDTYKAIDAAVRGMRRVIESGWKKDNVELVKTKFQEFKEHCLSGTIMDAKANPVRVMVGGIETLLPETEQLAGESLNQNQEVTVYVQELRQTAAGHEVIVSRRHPTLVSHAMRRQISEVDLGVIEIKAVGRIAGKRSRVSVYSKNLAALERCNDKASNVSEDIGGEPVEFIEWYADIKANIVSSLKVEARDVHIIESERQALVEVFKESNIDGESLELGRQLTGYQIEVKLVPKDSSTELPGV